MIAALFVEPKGVYAIPGVDLWDEARDARSYRGPWPVVAHPPCARWGAYSEGGPSHHGRFKTGDDGGCFASALASVRQWGGVLEHPRESKAWPAFGLQKPPAGGGWVTHDGHEWTCQVEQGHYGHRARKKTWLLYVGPQPFELIWGPSEASLPSQTKESLAARGRGAYTPHNAIERMCRRERLATPIPFRDVLLALAKHSQGGARCGLRFNGLDGLTFRREGDAVARGQYNETIYALLDGKPVGYLAVSIYNGRHSVDMVEVLPKYRRRGVATALYLEMFREAGIKARDLGRSSRTEEGAAFRAALAKKLRVLEKLQKTKAQVARRNGPRLNAEISRVKRGRPQGTFYGNDSEWFYTEEYPLGLLRAGYWVASIGLSNKNEWRNLSVEGATEDHVGFRQALQEIVKEYPEVVDYIVDFDGPAMPVRDIVDRPILYDLTQGVYYHGTSTDVLDAVLSQGLRPRSETGAAATFGVELGAQGSKQPGVYLTTQMGLARAAAVSAARQRKGKPVVLQIQGGLSDRFLADEDSGETNPQRSLEKMGSVVYAGTIRPQSIQVLRFNGRTYWGRQGAGIVFYCPSTRRILLGLRSGDVMEPGTWGGFGGRIDDDDVDPLDAALREVGEETGFDAENIVSVDPLWTYERQNFRYFNFLAEVEHEFTPELNWENRDARWFRLDRLPKPLHYGFEALLPHLADALQEG